MRHDSRFADNPLVEGAPHLRFYAGMVLVTPRGTVLGTFAVIDTEPRNLSLFQQNSLALIARQIVDQLELRTAYRELAALRAQEQSFEARLWREKAEEAQRLAAELHDGVGQDSREFRCSSARRSSKRAATARRSCRRSRRSIACWARRSTRAATRRRSTAASSSARRGLSARSRGSSSGSSIRAARTSSLGAARRPRSIASTSSRRITCFASSARRS